MDLMVLVDESWGIGCSGEQMVYLSQDLKRFKEMTLGKTMVLGRKTLGTFPHGKPLVGRKHMILSGNPSFVVEGATVYSSLEDLLSAVSSLEEEEVMVIGGASVYEQLLPYCERAYVTKVSGHYTVDCYFPNLDQMEQWVLESQSETLEEGEVSFSYCIYTRLED